MERFAERNRTVRFSTHGSPRSRTVVQLKSDNFAIWFVINNTEKKNRDWLMYASVDGCAFSLPSTLQQQRWETNKEDKPFTLVQCEHVCWNMCIYSQVRPEQHTLISVFKISSCKLCQFTHKSQRTRAHAQWEDLCVRSSEVQILCSLWSIVFEWKNSLKNDVKILYAERTVSVHSLKVTALS